MLRAGIERIFSQGVRAFALRQARDRELVNTHLQYVATAAAINLDRLVHWFDAIPRPSVRRSHHPALAVVMASDQVAALDKGIATVYVLAIDTPAAIPVTPTLAPPQTTRLPRRAAQRRYRPRSNKEEAPHRSGSI